MGVAPPSSVHRAFAAASAARSAEVGVTPGKPPWRLLRLNFMKLRCMSSLRPLRSNSAALPRLPLPIWEIGNHMAGSSLKGLPLTCFFHKSAQTGQLGSMKTYKVGWDRSDCVGMPLSSFNWFQI